MTTRLQEHYDKVLKPALREQFNYANALQVPKLQKIVINMGVGEAIDDAKKMDSAVNEMTVISASPESLMRSAASTAFSSNPFTTGGIPGAGTTRLVA